MSVPVCTRQTSSTLPACSPLPYTVRLYEYQLGWHEEGWVRKVLVEAFEVEGAAVEFGGEARCQESDAAGAEVELLPWQPVLQCS